jgi:hypothetical protein
VGGAVYDCMHSPLGACKLRLGMHRLLLCTIISVRLVAWWWREWEGVLGEVGDGCGGRMEAAPGCGRSCG